MSVLFGLMFLIGLIFMAEGLTKKPWLTKMTNWIEGLIVKPLDKGWKIILTEIVVTVVIYLVIMKFTTPIAIFGGYTFSWQNLWFWSALLYIGLSFRFWDVIGPDQIGVRTIFGQPVGTVNAGLPIVPPGIGDIQIFPTITQQREFPAEPQNIFRGEDKEEAPEGKVPPLRITFGESLTAENAEKILGEYYTVTRADGSTITFQPEVPKDALSNSRVTAEVTPIVRWRITDAVPFVQNIGTIEEVNRQIEDEMVVVLNTIYPRISVAQAQQNVEWMNALLFKAVSRRIGAQDGHSDAWGIDLEGAAVKPISFNHSLNKSISGVAEASFKGEATVREATRAAEATVITGAATAKAKQALEKATVAGKGQGIAAAAKSTGLTPAEIIGAETAQAVGKGDGTIIVGADGVTQLAGIAAAFAPKPAPTQTK